MVTWAEIAEECESYRDGFVSVYRRYEGEETDKKDKQGRPVKVTKASFAAYLGISDSTFGAWVRKAEGGPRRASGPNRSGQLLRQTAKNPKVSVEDKVGALSDLLSDTKVLKAYRERRAPKVTPEALKAAEAAADAITAPIVQAAGRLQVPSWVDDLNEIADGISEQELEPRDIKALGKAARRVTEEVQVQEFRLGLEVSQ